MSIKHIIRKIITTLLNAILSFVVFLIIVIFYMTDAVIIMNFPMI